MIVSQSLTAGIKAVTVVGSFAGVGNHTKPFYENKGVVYTENDWLPLTEEDCEAMNGSGWVWGREHEHPLTFSNPMAPVMWYCASKKFAELAAYETQKRVGAKYSLATVLPPREPFLGLRR